MPMIFDKLEMNGHIETQKMTKVTFFFKKNSTFGNSGPPNTKYLYYPHIDGVTLKGSLFPANITQNKQ